MSKERFVIPIFVTFQKSCFHSSNFQAADPMSKRRTVG